MTAADIKPGFTLEFVQSLGTNALALYQLDPVKHQEAFSNALSFAQKLTTVNFAKIHEDLRSAKVVIDESMTKTKPADRAQAEAKGRRLGLPGKMESTVNVAQIVADVKALFSL